MHIIVAYDVKANRTQTFKKICQRYLPRVQNSVFEGKLSESQLLRLRDRLKKEIKDDEMVRIWVIADSQIYRTYIMGGGKRDENIIL